MKTISSILVLFLFFVLSASAEQFGLFTYTVSDEEITITDYPENATGHVEIPAEIDGLPVTMIGDGAFFGCTGLTSITISEGVTSIGDSAFSGCIGLTSITIPDSVTSIELSAFSSCTGLHSVIFLGDAPILGGNNFLNPAPDFTIYYLAGSTGFTSPVWHGSPAVMLENPVSPTTLWLVSQGLPHDADLNQDLNGDGVSLLMAYALGLDPHANLSSRLPAPVLTNRYLSLTFPAAANGITYTVETSTDLQHWTTEGVTFSDLDPGQRRTASARLDTPRRFLRLVVTLSR
jgi:hypothetical protein